MSGGPKTQKTQKAPPGIMRAPVNQTPADTAALQSLYQMYMAAKAGIPRSPHGATGMGPLPDMRAKRDNTRTR